MNIERNIRFFANLLSISEGTLKEISERTGIGKRIYCHKMWLVAQGVLEEMSGISGMEWNNGRTEKIYKVNKRNLRQILYGDWPIGHIIYGDVKKMEHGIWAPNIKPKQVKE